MVMADLYEAYSCNIKSPQPVFTDFSVTIIVRTYLALEKHMSDGGSHDIVCITCGVRVRRHIDKSHILGPSHPVFRCDHSLIITDVTYTNGAVLKWCTKCKKYF